MKAIWPQIQGPAVFENRLDQFGLEAVWGQAVNRLERSRELNTALSIAMDDLSEEQIRWPGLWMSTIRWIKRCVDPICMDPDP